jgi:hypothetical protein
LSGWATTLFNQELARRGDAHSVYFAAEISVKVSLVEGQQPRATSGEC